MDILVPVDGSECSDRALETAIDIAVAFDAELHVIHISDAQTDATDTILANAKRLVEESYVADEPELVIQNLGLKRSSDIGKAIVAYAEEHGYDHVVMGHHGAGRIEQAFLGSAAKTVVNADSVRTTVVP